MLRHQFPAVETGLKGASSFSYWFLGIAGG